MYVKKRFEETIIDNTKKPKSHGFIKRRAVGSPGLRAVKLAVSVTDNVNLDFSHFGFFDLFHEEFVSFHALFLRNR